MLLFVAGATRNREKNQTQNDAARSIRTKSVRASILADSHNSVRWSWNLWYANTYVLEAACKLRACAAVAFARYLHVFGVGEEVSFAFTNDFCSEVCLLCAGSCVEHDFTCWGTICRARFVLVGHAPAAVPGNANCLPLSSLVVPCCHLLEAFPCLSVCKDVFVLQIGCWGFYHLCSTQQL